MYPLNQENAEEDGCLKADILCGKSYHIRTKKGQDNYPRTV